MPASQTFSVEKFDDRAIVPGPVINVANDRSPNTAPFQRRPGLAFYLICPMKRAAGKPGGIDEMAGPVLPTSEARLWSKPEHQSVAGNRYLFDGIKIPIEGADEIA